MLVVFVLLVFQTYIESKSSRLKYTWMPDSAQFDFMVGISYNDVPVASGLLIAKTAAYTAATPLRYYKINDGHIKGVLLNVHVICREWDKSVAVKVTNVLSIQNAYNYTSEEAFDKSGIYDSVHDLACLTLEKKLPTTAGALAVRHPIAERGRDLEAVFKSSDVFTILGHGYADRLHVQQNVELEAVDYLVEDVLVNCDEWIPRPWGHFVCLLNVDNFVGISSGAVILHNGNFVAVGSFSLMRGDETILVLTDVHKYKDFRCHFNNIYSLEDLKPPMWE